MVIASRIHPHYDEEQGISFHYRSVLLPDAIEKLSPKTAFKISWQVSQPSCYQLCNVKLLLKCDISEKTTSKPPHSTPALTTKPTDPLLPQPTTLLIASASFTVQTVKDTGVHLSQTEGEVYNTTARVAAPEISTALMTRMRRYRNSYSF